MSILQKLESNKRLNQIEFKGLKIWPIIRSKIHLQVIKSKYHFDSSKRNYWAALKSIFYGCFELLFKRPKYLLFNNTNKRRLVNGKYFDIYFDGLADILGQNNCLFVEWSANYYYSSEKVYSKHVTSDSILKFLALLAGFFLRVPTNKDLEEIFDDFKFEINYKEYLKKDYALYLIYWAYLNLVNPERVYLISYYTKVPLVIAANELDIEVVELQHGLINKKHHAYYVERKFPKKYYPDKLITYGEDLIDDYSDNFIYKKNKIFPVGFFYIEYIKNEYSSKFLKDLKERYCKIICVTLQGIYVESILDSVNYLAEKYPKMLFVIRFKENHNYDSPKENILTLESFDIYQVLKYSSVNITIYSTVAIEANFFGVGTILLNYDGLSDKYLEGVEIMKKTINPNELKYLNFKELQFSSKKKYRKFFKKNYMSNLKELVNCSA